MRDLKSQDGAITLAVVITIFFSALALVTALSFAGIGELISGYQTSTSERALTITDSCIHEALLRLKQDNDYSGDTLSIGDDSCTISVSGSGADRTVTVTTASRNTTRTVEVDAGVAAGSVSQNSWLEDTN